MDEWLPRAGNLIFAGGVLLACAAAVAQVLEAVYGRRTDDATRERTRRELRRGFAIAAGLAAAQVIFLVLCYTVSWMRPAAGIGFFYLGCAFPVPFLWAAGRMDQGRLGWPLWSGQWISRKRLLALSGAAVVGVAVAMLAFGIAGAEPGASVQEMSRQAENVSSLAMIAIWLMINAPWIEEIVFRHYMLARLAHFGAGRLTAVIAAIALTSVIFALGHAGHTIPVWPKLVQMIAWGLALGGVQIWLGTAWAVGLHLVWNLCAPFVALVV